MNFSKMMKAAAGAATLALIAGQAIAAECSPRQTEYLVDWTSFAMMDADPRGRPTRAYAFPVDTKSTNNPANRVQVNLEYTGDVPRFSFDHPKVSRRDGLPGGVFEVRQNLLQPYEMTETRITFDRPVSNLTMILGKIDDNAEFGRSHYDRVSVLYKGFRGQIKSPDVRPIGLPDQDERAIMAYEKNKGFSGKNIYPINLTSFGMDEFASFEAAHEEDVKYLAVRLTSMTSQAGSFATSQNPSPQDLEIGEVTFCLDR